MRMKSEFSLVFTLLLATACSGGDDEAFIPPQQQQTAQPQQNTLQTDGLLAIRNGEGIAFVRSNGNMVFQTPDGVRVIAQRVGKGVAAYQQDKGNTVHVINKDGQEIMQVPGVDEGIFAVSDGMIAYQQSETFTLRRLSDKKVVAGLKNICGVQDFALSKTLAAFRIADPDCDDAHNKQTLRAFNVNGRELQLRPQIPDFHVVEDYQVSDAGIAIGSRDENHPNPSISLTAMDVNGRILRYNSHDEKTNFRRPRTFEAAVDDEVLVNDFMLRGDLLAFSTNCDFVAPPASNTGFFEYWFSYRLGLGWVDSLDTTSMDYSCNLPNFVSVIDMKTGQPLPKGTTGSRMDYLEANEYYVGEGLVAIVLEGDTFNAWGNSITIYNRQGTTVYSGDEFDPTAANVRVADHFFAHQDSRSGAVMLRDHTGEPVFDMDQLPIANDFILTDAFLLLEGGAEPIMSTMGRAVTVQGIAANISVDAAGTTEGDDFTYYIGEQRFGLEENSEFRPEPLLFL